MNGRDSAWFRGTQAQHEGHIEAGGVSKDVTLADPGEDIGDDLDSVYRDKYHRYAASIVDSIMTPQARAATLKLVAR